MSDMATELKAWRERLGITQARAAAVLDVPLRTFQGWEAGRDFDRPVILKFALAHVEKNARTLLT